MREFKLSCCDPMDSGHKVYKRTKFTINPGLTILTGCNGAGKTTLIRTLKDKLREQNILFCHYDNLHDGGDVARQYALERGEMYSLAALVTSSEGECININLFPFVRNIARYADTLDKSVILSRSERLAIAFNGEKEYIPNELWVLLDASDSGLSINAVIELKDILHRIEIKLAEKNITAYFIIAANEYEMCVGENCLDVQSLTYKQYKSYNSYKRAILRSAKYKEDQITKSRKEKKDE